MNQQDILKAAAILEREFGPEWRTIAQTLGTEDLCTRVGKPLTSFMAFPERGEGGSSKWRGNCSPEVVRAVAQYCMQCKRYNKKDISQFTLLDPMSGSGTSKAVADQLGVNSVMYDLNPNPAVGLGNWNALKNDVEDTSDLIFFHPPYHDIIRYSGNMWGKPHPDDLSRCENYADFIEKLNFIIKKLFMSLKNDGRLAILVGDIRTKGKFYSMQEDMMRMGQEEAFIVKGQFNCVSDNRTYAKPFIPIVTEYLVLLHKQDPIIVPFSKRMGNTVNIMESEDVSITWNHLIRSVMEKAGGFMSLEQLYEKLANHPKAKKNTHFKERIRATIYEHPQIYNSAEGKGNWALTYKAA